MSPQLSHMNSYPGSPASTAFSSLSKQVGTYYYSIYIVSIINYNIQSLVHWWSTLVEYIGGVHWWNTYWWSTLVEYIWWSTLVEYIGGIHIGGVHWWSTLVEYILVEYIGGVHWWNTLVEYIGRIHYIHAAFTSHSLSSLILTLVWCGRQLGGRQQRLPPRLPPLRLKNPAGKVKLSQKF